MLILYKCNNKKSQSWIYIFEDFQDQEEYDDTTSSDTRFGILYFR